MESAQTSREVATAVAGRQHGVLSGAQAARAGLSHDQTSGLVRAGTWRRAIRGVYVVAGAPDTTMQRLWIAYLAVAPADGVLSHLSAIGLAGLGAPSPLPHVEVPPGHSVRADVARVHRGTVPLVDRTTKDGLRLTTVSRTLADLAAILDRPSLECFVDDAFTRRLATPESALAAALRAGPRRRGTALLRAVVDVWSGGVTPESVAEVRLLRQLAELGVGGLETQFVVRDVDGGFVARLDVALPAIRAGLEYDGALHHGPRAWEANEERFARLRAAGWTVDVVDKADLRPGATRLREIAAAWSALRAA